MNVELTSDEKIRVMSGFRTVKEAANAIKETTSTPSQESMLGIKDIFIGVA